MEEIVERSLLYDFYGSLLTDHQSRIYRMAVFNDLSLSEIAEAAGISRQAASDLLKRVDRQLEAYEKHLHLVSKFQKIRSDTEQIKALASKKDPDSFSQIDTLADRILGEI
ncbi:MAG: YlxM family DNA-binding protein [Lachnospiraceae bacterium]